MCGAGLQTGPDLNCLVIVLAAPLHIPISKPASLSILCPKSPLPQIGPRPPSPWSSPRPGHLLLPPKLLRHRLPTASFSTHSQRDPVRGQGVACPSSASNFPWLSAH